ncbi:hypothetical protein EV360DRAFT_72935 [Lentinula raphanica]|nr:hypothetical protein EV360DRAFT_72935 [Lentinula raphanica]
MLSDEWLTGDAVDCILDVIRANMVANAIDATVAEATLCVMIGSGGSRAQWWGKKIEAGHIKRLIVPWNIPRTHWLWFEIDVEETCIRIGDSKPSVSAAYLENILLQLHRWLRLYLPTKSFMADDDSLVIPVQEQQDSFSCVSNITCAQSFREKEEDEWRKTVQQLLDEIQAFKTSEAEPIERPPNNREEDMKTARSSAFDVGTSDTFKFNVLVAERLTHETNEVKSAVAYRFRHQIAPGNEIGLAEADAKVAKEQSKSKARAARKVSGDGKEDELTENPTSSTPVLDAQVLNTLSRYVSETLTGTGKLDTAGVERRTRWKMIGITGKLEDVDLTIPSDEVSASNVNRQMYLKARSLYQPLESVVNPLAPVTANISPLTPLCQESWVLVYFKEAIYLGQVKVIYVEGGGKNITHNYTPSCSDILKISRIVVLLFEPLAGFYSPMFAQPRGYAQAPTFAFLHQANIIASLDMVGSVMDMDNTQGRVRFAHGLYLERPSNPFKIFYSLILPHIPEITRVAAEVLRACNMRRKRGPPDTSGSSEKRQRT